jgi:tagaturonate reductase
MKALNQQAVTLSTRPIKVLQFGEGNFLRAFADWIIDILNEKTDFNGNIQIVQPLPSGMIQALKDQDCLYHVVLNGIQQGKTVSETRLIKSVSSAINPYVNESEFITACENLDLKFVISNTTESGIEFNEADTRVDVLPASFPGKITKLLYHRFTCYKGAEDKGLYFLPCELIEKNGENLKRIVLQYVDHWKLSTEFKNWIIETCVFCNTLVDRIVPGFPKDTIKEIQQQLGFEDNLVVSAEPFHLWVIEAPLVVKKAFPTEKAGLQVKFVPDLTPYRTRKVRILNGAHTALVPVAYLSGLRLVKESVDDPTIGKFIREAISEEIVPTLDLPAEELQQFANDVIERFQNPFIKHELISISLNSISKFKVRVLPSLLGYYKKTGKLPERLVFSLAALIRFYKGEWQGETIPLNDSAEILDFFKQAWALNDSSKTIQTVLSNQSLWGIDLTTIAGFEKMVLDKLAVLEENKTYSL